MNFNNKRFANWMKEMRKKNEMSLYALGPKIDMHPTGLARIETGELDIRMSTFIKICNGFGKNPAKIMAEMVDVL